MDLAPLERYALTFSNLRTDRESGRPRPHKAVMLLSVLTLAEAVQLADGSATRPARFSVRGKSSAFRPEALVRYRRLKYYRNLVWNHVSHLLEGNN